MPNIKSAKKRARQNEERRERNRRDRSRMRTALRKVREAEDPETGRERMREAESLLDRLATKGVIHANTAARHKSRLRAHVRGLEE
ncbi:MAG: 30S ribosomal protein S20 [Gemmatimonadota bacterium]|nr:30S ribosomal protein S20 [Gemmatimonadota bacterium]